MDRERNTPRTTDRSTDEVYERIPWETLERPPRDNNRLVLAVAGAVVVGALAFSFVRSQPAPPPAAAPVPVNVPETAPVTVPTPILRSEADLYAVEHDRMASHAAGHAEWFAVEYLAYDGSTASQATLEGLLPVGTPLPQAVEGTQVVVDWAGVISIAETGNLGFEVEVLVRSMVSAPGEGFVRVEPSVVVVEVAIGPDGIPRVVRPPQVERHTTVSPFVMSLVAIPDSLKEEVEGIYGPVVGGEQLGDGRWRVVLMATDPDGVTRPRTVIVP